MNHEERRYQSLEVIRLRRILLVSVACLILAAVLTVVAASRPVINSVWTNNPPTIDGKFTAGEWPNSPQIIITQPIEAYVYFMNDRSKLYVLVDAVGDTTDSPGDECLLVFGSDEPWVDLDIIGSSGTIWSGSFYAVIGYGSSPNSPSSHKIYEWSIPLSLINGLTNRTLDFCSPPFKHGLGSMPYDPQTGRDNVWPSGLDVGGWGVDKTTWGILKLANEPVTVGGEIAADDNLKLLVPFLLVSVSASIAVAIGTSLRRKTL